MGEERESGGAGVPSSQSCTKAAPAAKHRRPDASVTPRARYCQRPGAQPAWPLWAAALPTPSPAGAALPPHRELFLLLGSTPLKVVVVVMAPRSEVGCRGSRELKDRVRGAQTRSPTNSRRPLQKPPPPPAWLAAAFIGLSNPAPILPALADSNSSLLFYWSSGVPSTVLRHDWLLWSLLNLNPPASWSGKV